MFSRSLFVGLSRLFFRRLFDVFLTYFAVFGSFFFFPDFFLDAERGMGTKSRTLLGPFLFFMSSASCFFF